MLSPTLVGDWEFEVSDTTLPHQVSESVSRGRHDHAHVDRFALERRPGDQVHRPPATTSNLAIATASTS